MAGIRKLEGHSNLWQIPFVIFSSTGIFLAINQLFNLSLFGLQLVETSYFYLMIGCFLPFVFIFYPAYESAPTNKVPWYDSLLFFVNVVTSIYFCIHGYDIIQLGWEYSAPLTPTLFSVFLWALVLEAVRRTTDLWMLSMCIIVSAYPLFADYLPGFLMGQSYDVLTTARMYAMGRNGIIGIPLDVTCTLLLGFMVFGVVMQTTGGGAFFFKLAESLLGNSRGGSAKITIFATALFGMISGSTTSNVLAIGAMTIPAMKKSGFSSRYAAAITACGSTGGPIMPPVMGTAAFIMAFFLNVPYSYVAIGALIPACLYYLGLFVQVDCHAAKLGLKRTPRSDLPPFWKTLKEGWFYILIIVLLIYFLLISRMEGRAPYYVSAFMIIIPMLRKATRLNWRDLISIITETGKVISNLMSILAAAGLIIGGLSVTGTALAFSSELVGAVGNNVYLILLMGAISSFILGFGMTITACYIFLAIVMVPALVNLGVDPLAAHLFVFYWGVLSEITPPVAVCVSAACGLAGAPFMPTGWLAMKLGIVKYIVPFFFAIDPALLTHGAWWEVLICTASATVGIFYLASGLEGYLVGVGKLKLLSRSLLILGGLLTAFPEIITTVIGIALLVIVSFVGRIRAKGKEELEAHSPLGETVLADDR